MSLSPRPITLTLVDDNELSVAGLTSLLTPYAHRIRHLDLRAALARPTELDVVLHEPLGCSTISARLRNDLLAAGSARSVVLTWAPTQELVADPADPVLSKSMTAAQLVRALEDIVAGREVPAPRVSGSMSLAGTTSPPVRKGSATPAATSTGPAPTLHRRDDLTAREVQVLTLITQGLTNEEIGRELLLSINSIKTYVRSAYRKIGVSRRTQAVAWGLEHGLLEGTAAEESVPVPV